MRPPPLAASLPQPSRSLSSAVCRPPARQPGSRPGGPTESLHDIHDDSRPLARVQLGTSNSLSLLFSPQISLASRPIGRLARALQPVCWMESQPARSLQVAIHSSVQLLSLRERERDRVRFFASPVQYCERGQVLPPPPPPPPALGGNFRWP